MQRVAFIGSATALSAAAFLRDTALAAGLAAHPPDLVPLVATLLPPAGAGVSGVSAETIAARVEAIFHLGESAAFRASVATFSDLAAFAGAGDRRAFDASGLSASGTFASLNATDRATYLRIWATSERDVRRRFYGSIRAVTLIAFYSLPDVWAAIDYAGPVLPQRPR